jgi:putative transposase
LVDRQDGAVSVRTQAALLGVVRSGLYYRPGAPGAADVQIKHRLDELYTAHPFYGSRRLAVQRHRREMGIAGIAPAITATDGRRVLKVLDGVIAAGRDGSPVAIG